MTASLPLAAIVRWRKPAAILTIVAAIPPLCFSQTASPAKDWKKHEDAGKKAFADKRLYDADREFDLAVEAANKTPSDDAHLSESLNERAEVCLLERHFSDADVLLRRAVAIDSARLGTNDIAVAAEKLGLASLCGTMRRFDEGHVLIDQAQSAVEKKGGPKSSAVGICKLRHADLYLAEGRLQEAETFFQEALARLDSYRVTYNFRVLTPGGPPIVRTTWSPNLSILADARNDLGYLCLGEGKYSEAEECFKTALDYLQHDYGSRSPTLVRVLNSLASVNIAQNHLPEARKALERAASLEKTFNPDDPRVTLTARLSQAAAKAAADPASIAGKQSK